MSKNKIKDPNREHFSPGILTEPKEVFEQEKRLRKRQGKPLEKRSLIAISDEAYEEYAKKLKKKHYKLNKKNK